MKHICGLAPVLVNLQINKMVEDWNKDKDRELE
jgi:hypothetical protein